MTFDTSDDMVAAARDAAAGTTSADMLAEAKAGATRVDDNTPRRRSWSPERSRAVPDTAEFPFALTTASVGAIFGPSDYRYDAFAPAPHENPTHPDYHRARYGEPIKRDPTETIRR